MNNAMDADRPYVEIADDTYGPYVELILRSGIAVKHPTDPNQLRLLDFMS